MFTLAEVPLVGHWSAPTARARVVRFQGWLGENGRRITNWAAIVSGVYLRVKGIVGLT
jgi:hypothetical protein